MKIYSIKDKNVFSVLNSLTGQQHLGCDQQWYLSEWQRLSGCGPVAASNIVFYIIYKERAKSAGQGIISKSDCRSLMEDVWKYVTPTSEGIPDTNMFADAVLSYAGSKGLELTYAKLDVPQEERDRPGIEDISGFISDALSKDTPVAFLNLDNGDEKYLDEWHWVTIISLEHSGEEIYAGILDEGTIKHINLKLWHNTTTLGGGFVHFTLRERDNKHV